MPRRARLAIAGIPWHIIQRGNNRSACFFTENDYLYYLDQLQRQSLEFGCQIHAHCLMTNHVHLLVTPDARDSASLMMKNLGQRYVQYINRTYRRSGTLWDGRFKSCLAQDEHYALRCYRYIELNPVRAGMVAHPQAYRWSSFHFNGSGISSDLVTPHPSYLGLGCNKTERMKAYRQFLEQGAKDSELKEIRNATNGNFVLGDDRFQAKIERALHRRVSPGQPGRPKLAG